jgi:hypothetical protein
MVHAQQRKIGLWFSSTEVETGDKGAKETLVRKKMVDLMQGFAEASSRGSKAAIEFLQVQDTLRSQSAATIRQVFSAANASNQATTKTLKRWEAGLKTTEYGASMIITVASLFVSAAPVALVGGVGVRGTLLAGILGFSYDTVTTVIYDHHEASATDADVVALVSPDIARRLPKGRGTDVAVHSVISAGKETAKDFLSGKDLEAIEKLEEKVAHLHAKIAVKQAMIHETSSQHNIARLTRSIGKNEGEVSSSLKTIGRFRAVTYLFAAYDLFDKGKEIRKAWHSE